jgi:hypothetical protein
METWKPALGWNGIYEVSDQGRVRSLPRETLAGRAGLRLHPGKVIAPFIRQERRFVNLFDGDKRATCTVHRLVLEAFVGPRPRGMECRHLDGDPANNHLGNLVWGTKIENETDKVRHGTKRRPPLTDDEINVIRFSPKKQQDLADLYGVTQSFVSRVKLGKRGVP